MNLKKGMNVFGIDVSKYAVSKSPKNIKKYNNWKY